jgi:formyltetrahydrofolate deformylase
MSVDRPAGPSNQSDGDSAARRRPGRFGDALNIRLLITCPDRPGIVAAVSQFLSNAGANIVSSSQHSTDPQGGQFFMRMEFNLRLEPGPRAQLEERFAEHVAAPLKMEWRMWDAHRPKRVAILVSRRDHCLQELLWRWQDGQLAGDIVLVASNHADLRAAVEAVGLPFHHIPVEAANKAEAELQLLEVLSGRVDLVVLARYMQILTEKFLERVEVPVINIHHSFLPAFAGAGAYERAKARGVKLIGATAHYVTAELDAGPIIEQDVIRVNHRDDVEGLTRRGADIERTVLSRAVQWHCEDRLLVHGGTTVAF